MYSNGRGGVEWFLCYAFRHSDQERWCCDMLSLVAEEAADPVLSPDK